jgi:hypothetical protein
MKTILSILGVFSAIFFNSAPQVIQLDSNESVELAREGALCKGKSPVGESRGEADRQA